MTTRCVTTLYDNNKNSSFVSSNIASNAGNDNKSCIFLLYFFIIGGFFTSWHMFVWCNYSSRWFSLPPGPLTLKPCFEPLYHVTDTTMCIYPVVFAFQMSLLASHTALPPGGHFVPLFPCLQYLSTELYECFLSGLRPHVCHDCGIVMKT